MLRETQRISQVRLSSVPTGVGVGSVLLFPIPRSAASDAGTGTFTARLQASRHPGCSAAFPAWYLIVAVPTPSLS
jgi:hypothetical protein